ncbi:DSD1 family PLP-dependent enzyme [Moritella sp.]|uniref:DSD1 family PLP-dependent enzyme n=1 Tax=Moritella sp. TaxID=78556 RepID=UPI0025D50874|nr:DSD1 family PLP-dependent enzyme [Moritella sp.]MCJ8348781.1 DSD1 family PLP-dependent enzyme [Moritella sp.]
MLIGNTMPITTSLAKIDTPFLLVDKAKFDTNVAFLRATLAPHNVILRPHLKTVKSIAGAKHILEGFDSPATVSTVKEAEAFADAGYSNLIYAVGIVPQKLPRIQALLNNGINISILLDSVAQAKAVAAFCQTQNIKIPTLLEVDCDGHRGGIQPDDTRLVEIARILHQGGAELRGVLTHAGESYDCISKAALVAAAEGERSAAVVAATQLIESGLPCPVVSVGSTPTAHFAENLDGVTEVRAGVYTFFDLVMAGIGVCKPDDIALSVVTSVIGHNEEKDWLFIDAGWMSLSQDRGTQSQRQDCGYGLVCDNDGNIISGLQVIGVNQEHGIIAAVSNDIDGAIDSGKLMDIAVGTQLRILPNHACATAAMHAGYYVADPAQIELDYWQRIQGW